MTAIKHSPAEYFAKLIPSPFKLEYLDGVIREMAGAGPPHNRIQSSLIGQMYQSRRSSSLEFFGSDMAVAAGMNSYLFPDASLAFDAEFEPRGVAVLLNPIVIFEILSESTESVDRGEKFHRYGMIPTLQDYVLIDSTDPVVDVFSRGPGEPWSVRTYTISDGSFALPSVGIEINLELLYERVFPA